jgi:hypothetical protein
VLKTKKSHSLPANTVTDPLMRDKFQFYQRGEQIIEEKNEGQSENTS